MVLPSQWHKSAEVFLFFFWNYTLLPASPEISYYLRREVRSFHAKPEYELVLSVQSCLRVNLLLIAIFTFFNEFVISFHVADSIWCWIVEYVILIFVSKIDIPLVLLALALVTSDDDGSEQRSSCCCLKARTKRELHCDQILPGSVGITGQRCKACATKKND